jgi:ABC-type transport system involved in cytochrome c biogenesis permease subunit
VALAIWLVVSMIASLVNNSENDSARIFVVVIVVIIIIVAVVCIMKRVILSLFRKDVSRLTIVRK